MLARVALSGWLIAAAAGAQTFEVATVKPSDPSGTIGIRKLSRGRAGLAWLSRMQVHREMRELPNYAIEMDRFQLLERKPTEN